jgi:carbamoyltransferase
VLTMDGVGEWATTSLAIGRGSTLEILQEINFPHSIGLLYSAFTYYTGFKVNSGEYKVMGLAPYGEPKHLKKIFDYLEIFFKDNDISITNFSVGTNFPKKTFDDMTTTIEEEVMENIR